MVKLVASQHISHADNNKSDELTILPELDLHNWLRRRSCRAAAARSGIAKAGRRKLTAIATKHAPRMGARLVEDILAAPPGHEPPS